MHRTAGCGYQYVNSVDRMWFDQQVGVERAHLLCIDGGGASQPDLPAASLGTLIVSGWFLVFWTDDKITFWINILYLYLYQ